jgi:phosphatidylglycerol:prolipoprotein diacylglycerol transferase
MNESFYFIIIGIGTFLIWQKLLTLPQKNKILPLFSLILLASFLGAKILYWSVTLKFQAPLNYWWSSGFTVYGAILLLSLVFYLLKKVRKLTNQEINIFLPRLIFIHALGRLGCWLNGCCYGVFWKIQHPVQLYELSFLLVLSIYLKNKINNNENKNWWNRYLILYALGRFCLEFFRGDNDQRGMLFTLSTSQWISLFIVIFFLIKKILRGNFALKYKNMILK